MRLQRLEKFKNIDIYPVTCKNLSKGRSNEEVCEAVLKGGARIIQLRDKEVAPRELLKTARRLREITDRYQALLIINDYPDIALKAGADGVHLGQNDMPAAVVRKKAPAILIGLSTHNQQEIINAQSSGADYINVGPVFETATKETNVTPVGTALIEFAAHYGGLPFSVMGGIKAENIPAVCRAGARKVAVVSALTKASDISAETKKLINIINTSYERT